MERSLNEILDACGRVLPEMKQGTKERTILSLVAKDLKRCVHDSQVNLPSVSVATPPLGATVAAATETPPLHCVELSSSSGAQLSSAADGHASRAVESKGPCTVAPYAAAKANARADTSLEKNHAASSSDGTATVCRTATQQFLRSDDSLNRLAYACRMAVLQGSAGLTKGSSKPLTGALELAAVILTSGIIPSDFVASDPVFSIASSSSNSAQVFFSKLLGGRRGGSTGQGKGPVASDLSRLGTEAEPEAPGPNAEKVALYNVRGSLVDAVLSVAEVAQGKECVDRMWFALITALLSGAVPRVSRPGSQMLNSTELKTQQLQIHGKQLLHTFQFLLSLCARPPSISTILVEEARNAIHAIGRALSKFLEQDSQNNALTAATGSPDLSAPIAAEHQTTEVIPTLNLQCSTSPVDAYNSEEEAEAHSSPKLSNCGDSVIELDSGVRTQLPKHADSALAMVPLPPFHQLPSFSAPQNGGLQDMIMLLELCAAVARLSPLTGLAADNGVSPITAAVSDIPTSTKGGGATACRPDLNSAASFSGGNLVEDGSLLSPQMLNANTLSVSLGFIFYCVVNGGPQFRKGTDVIKVVRHVIIPTAVRTSLSTDFDTFRLSLNVLLTTCLQFGPQLVSETSTVFRHVYFRVLESSFTSLKQKSLVLDAFGRYIEEPQLLIGLFLNYDCNTYSQSIYEMMIHYLGAIARPTSSQSAYYTHVSAELDRVLTTVRLGYEVPDELRRKALLTFLQVADSNIQWIERFECDQDDEGSGTGPGQAGTARDPTHNNSFAAPGDASDSVSPGTAAKDGDSAQPNPAGTLVPPLSSISTDAVLQVRRYKDAFRKFLDLFNVKAKPEAAVEFLRGSILSMESAKVEEEKTQRPNAANGKTEEEGVEHLDEPPSSTAATPPVAPPFMDGAMDSSTTDGVDEAERESARCVAMFLRSNDDYIDKMVLGDYFAKCFRKPSSRVVFEEWIRLHDFSNRALDVALRTFLGGFKLLGEAQVVDKTMELFAAQYCRQNPGVFSSADTAFILSFSICMLNTDAHSPHVKNKMTREGFLSNNRAIDEGKDIDPAILGGIYDRIVQEEIKLRPSPNCPTQSSTVSASGASGESSKSRKVSTNILESIPLLRHLTPIAAAITDTVLLPMDAAGSAIFNFSQRKREEVYQRELRSTLREVMSALQEASSSDAAHHAMFVTATSIENALPMWEVTVDLMCHLSTLSLQIMLEDSEAYVPQQSGNSERDILQGSSFDSVSAYMDDTQSYSYFDAVLHGLRSTIRVCCAFGNVEIIEQLLECMFEMTQLSAVVGISSTPSLHILVQSSLPFTRVRILAAFLNLFVQYGVSFNARGWQAAYKAMSLIDALANGIEGMWQRQNRRLRGTTGASKETGIVTVLSLKRASQKASDAACGAGGGRAKGCSAADLSPKAHCIDDLWFGNLSDVPAKIVDKKSLEYRASILQSLRSAKESHVDLWLDRLFDATVYPPMVQLEMTNGLVKVCQMELQYQRTFSLTKLFDFVSVCATFSSRLQWRDLWAHASEVFIIAGCMSNVDIALSALDGLRLIALTYLMREELLNYSFQKEVLMPFEEVLMNNQSVVCRMKVMTILSELIDLRAGHLASGWNVVFSCLSHAAAIPEIAPSAWGIAEGVVARSVDYVKDCFSDLIFCLTTFACSGEETIALQAVSYIVACGHWLQYGLEAPPPEVRDAAAVLQWATRFRTAKQECDAAQNLAKHLPRVTLAADPISTAAPLEKPSTFTRKTKYHLWMSLFEGMVPIVVIHSSPRVRTHALSSIWTLFAQYATAFSPEVQDSLFSGIVRSVLTTLLTQVRADFSDSTPDFARSDYRLLVYFALKGMLLACKDDLRLLALACDTLRFLISSTKLSIAMLRSDFIDVVLRVCYDLVWAVPASSTVDGLRDEGQNPLDNQAQNPERLYQWVAPAKRHRNPFVLGLIHELQQTGVVDVVQFKRTAGWTELHQTAVAQASSVQLPAAIQARSEVVESVRSTIFTCLTEMGLLGLLNGILVANAADRALCLEIVAVMRHVFLGLSYYYIVTRDVRAIGYLKLWLGQRGPASLQGHPKKVGDSSTPGEVADDLPSPVLESMLLMPYTTVLIEFIASFPLHEADKAALEADLPFYMNMYVAEMAQCRGFCVEAQQRALEMFKAEAESSAVAAPGGSVSVDSKVSVVVKPYKGKGFIDVFRVGRYDIGQRCAYFSAECNEEIRRRVQMEWSYMVHFYGIKCVAMLQEESVLLKACPNRLLLRILQLIPSEMEEAAVSDFLSSCWKEVDVHCNMPEECCFMLCTNELSRRLEVSSTSL